MPIYEYLCNKCSKDFELLVFGNKEIFCPDCNSDDVKKKLSLFGTSGTKKKVQSGGSCGSCHKSSCSTC